MIFQLIYHSQFLPVGAGPSSTIRAILRTSESNNFRDDVTGFLIFDKSTFVQILEGDRNAVLETYERIGRDPRHMNLTLIAARDVEARAFADWSMGGHLASEESRQIYARHGITGPLDPVGLRADQVISLARALLAFETLRQSQRTIGAA